VCTAPPENSHPLLEVLGAALSNSWPWLRFLEFPPPPLENFWPRLRFPGIAGVSGSSPFELMPENSCLCLRFPAIAGVYSSYIWEFPATLENFRHCWRFRS
jgi:hypothetical protein